MCIFHTAVASLLTLKFKVVALITKL